MFTVAVAEEEKGVLYGLLKDLLQKKDLAERVMLLHAPMQAQHPCRFDILVWNIGCCRSFGRFSASALVAAGEQAAAAVQACSADTLLTYGMGGKDTITPSSLLRPGGMAALQREVLSCIGNVLLPREIDLTGFSGDLLQKMAQASVLLLLEGVEKGKTCIS